jgi:TIR domain
MGIISKARLTTITETKLGYRTFTETIAEAKQESKYLATTTIFLSHSHDDLDKEYINKAIVFLRRLGIKVYIDSNDSSMPPFTSGETARKLKEAIKENKKFILLATNRAINSKWCNWELGFSDPHKYIDRVALFPLSENSGAWEGAEYLRIYPRIEESNYTEEYYKVIYPDGKEVAITDWLKT